MRNLNQRFADAASLTDAKVGLALFDNAAETYGLEPFTSKGITEARRILNLADQVDAAAWAAKQNKPYKEIAGQLIAGGIDAAQAVAQVTDAEHTATMNSGQHTPAGRLVINVRGAATGHLRDQDEDKVLDWLAPVFDQASADASAHCDIVDSIIGTEPQRDGPGVRTRFHPWEPRAVPLRRDRRLARAWEDLAIALGTVYDIAATIHQMRATGIIRRPLADTRDTVWSQVWETIPEGAFTGDTRPGRVREFYRCNRHQHHLTLATSRELDRNAGELPNDEAAIQDATMAMRDRMADAGYQSIFP